MHEPSQHAAPVRVRHSFASLAHATAHEVVTLRELLARARRDGLATQGLEALVLCMIAERGRFLSIDGPDLASERIEHATEERRCA